MKGKLSSYYTSKNSGRPVFVFTVAGTDEELKELKAAQGENFRVNDEGNPLFFSVSAHSCKKIGDTIDLAITVNNNVVVNDLAGAIARAERMERERDRVIATVGAIGSSVLDEATID